MAEWTFRGWQRWNLMKHCGLTPDEAARSIAAKLRRGGKRGSRAKRGMKYKTNSYTRGD